MSHFAKVVSGIVEEVIVADSKEWCETYKGGTWVQTSYNTYGGVHKLGGEPLRANYAGIGYTYDADADVFYAPQPFESWILNTKTYVWEAPKPYPAEGGAYVWNEHALDWDQLT
jgi:hypothetical protein